MARELNGVDIAIIVFGSLLLACGKYISCIYNERLAAIHRLLMHGRLGCQHYCVSKNSGNIIA